MRRKYKQNNVKYVAFPYGYWPKLWMNNRWTRESVIPTFHISELAYFKRQVFVKISLIPWEIYGSHCCSWLIHLWVWVPYVRFLFLIANFFQLFNKNNLEYTVVFLYLRNINISQNSFRDVWIHAFGPVYVGFLRPCSPETLGTRSVLGFFFSDSRIFTHT